MHTGLNEARVLSLESAVVALVGSPNTGKTTLFNWLTGSRYKTVNYPGATVEYSLGRTQDRFGVPVRVMDTPGTYSLQPKSPDEKVAIEAIYRHKTFGQVDLVVSVVDATQLSRHLYLTRQLLAAGFDVVVALTMMDLLQTRGETVDVEQLAQELGVPVVPIDGRLGGGVQRLTDLMREKIQSPTVTYKNPELPPHERTAIEMPIRRNAIDLTDWSQERTEKILRETAQLATKVLRQEQSGSQKKRNAFERTRKLDQVLLHPIWGLLIFITIMASLFSSIYWLATPMMDWIDGGFSAIGELIQGAGEGTLWADFLSNGLIASFAGVLVFVPQIFILFLGIVFLEDSGYLARSATLIDRPFSKIGLNGRSFVPLLSGYACAVPAMMAARTIGSRRERWITLFVIPLMSCSARLPVYALLLTFLFRGEAAWKAGLMLTGLYFLSALFGAIAATIVNRIIPKDKESFFLLELPVYRFPDVRTVIRQAVNRTGSYVRQAGPVIFVLAIIIWMATTFPRVDLEDATERLNHSYAAQVGQAIEPVFEPMGVDWRVGVGLISAFAAREVFVSSLAVVFSVAETEDEEGMQESLLTSMSTATMADGTPIFTLATCLGLVVFFMIALQCLSTTAVAAREACGWKFALVQLAVFNVVAYILAVSVVQGLRALGVT